MAQYSVCSKTQSKRNGGSSLRKSSSANPAFNPASAVRAFASWMADGARSQPKASNPALAHPRTSWPAPATRHADGPALQFRMGGEEIDQTRRRFALVPGCVAGLITSFPVVAVQNRHRTMDSLDRIIKKSQPSRERLSWPFTTDKHRFTQIECGKCSVLPCENPLAVRQAGSAHSLSLSINRLPVAASRQSAAGCCSHELRRSAETPLRQGSWLRFTSNFWRCSLTMKRASSSCPRSEERRVGKEGRSRWSPYH